MTHSHIPQVILPQDRLPLVLVGLPGAGKTTVARLLAQALGVQVTDTDAEIRRRARMTIPEIFAAEGEEGFREREHRALHAVLDSPAAAQGVIALGGGGVLRADNRRMLEGRTVIHLVASPRTAAAHVGDGSGRPLIGPGADSDEARAAREGAAYRADAVLARMEALDARRTPLYAEVATMSVPTDGLSPQQVAALILVALGVEAPQTARALAALDLPSQAAAAPEPQAPAAGREAGATADRDPGARPAGRPEGAVGPRSIGVGGMRPYRVLIGHGLEDRLVEAIASAPGAGRGGVALICDEGAGELASAYRARLARAGLRTGRIEVPGGERTKTTGVLDRVWGELGAMRLGRDGLVVGLGGGASTDLAGFAAATWLRGVPVIQVPTTLLAMVDAAVGGKTGINTAAGKNLVGAFHPPAAVLADLDCLATLDDRELRAGLAEVIKCGFIADPAILDLVLERGEDSRPPAWDSPVLAELVARAVAVKAEVVGEDLTESGLREILNYGHTYAHAIERTTDYQWRHGEAVAVGCVFAAEVAHRCGRIDAETVALHRRALSAVGLPVAIPRARGRWEEMRAVMLSDKKVRAGALRLVLLDGVGVPVRTAAPAEVVLEQAHQAVTAEEGGQ
ncbi:3-dehydroquinate synthase [Actinomyces bowdenii]|uniref:Multifunctional fusion protein n=1 Tax=Actinomyces bowdenii TaxID=131109 RepID=A0A3P1V8R2_9ACTO|nr:3-dehydroquinate synthase [Actinomyces bowdenii]RRD28983.1 3-dehydroquinate synthase [Actinomyces bowdenii]